MQPTSVQAPAPIPLAEGRVIDGRYRVGECIGEGGMGLVFAATHLGLGVRVAMKIIRPELASEPELVRRFENEARAAAMLKSEHVARVYDVGRLPTGEPYLVMEHLEGVELETFIESRRLDVQVSADIVREACEALAEAHAIGLVHRDIKPANLFLARCPDGRSTLKILDFGISKWLLSRARKALTQPGGSMGSPWYMSPEQMANPAAVDQRADVWSLGVVLYRLLTGELPFDGDSVPEVCARVLANVPVRPREHRRELDPELEAIVLRCLEKQPAQRFSSVTALAEALAPFGSLDGERASQPLSVDHRDTLRAALVRPESPARSRALGSVAVALVSAVVVGATASWLMAGDPIAPAWSSIAEAPSRLVLSGDASLRADDPELEPERAPVTGPAFAVRIAGDEMSHAVPALAMRRPARWMPVPSESIEPPRQSYREWMDSQGLKPLDEVLANGARLDESVTESILEESP
jgi:serine/threonine-protein kinase